VSEVVTAYELAPYTGSRDYQRLTALARRASIICVVDYQSLRDVARTNYMEKRGQELWSVSARGIAYITAFNEADFIALCEHHNVEFLIPPSV
jgi:hypothetical protein